MSHRKINPGVYLVIDPSMNEAELLDKLDVLTENPFSAIQVWDNFKDSHEIEPLIEKICTISHRKNIPVLINNQWKFLKSTSLDGVHFDEIPEFDTILKVIDTPFISGVTCNNNMEVIHEAANMGLDYISFCSMFPSTTANSCDLVNFESVMRAREIFTGPIFLAGGIKPENIKLLNKLDFQGVAIVSGIMSSMDPSKSMNKYLEALAIRNETEYDQ